TKERRVAFPESRIVQVVDSRIGKEVPVYSECQPLGSLRNQPRKRAQKAVFAKVTDIAEKVVAHRLSSFVLVQTRLRLLHPAFRPLQLGEPELPVQPMRVPGAQNPSPKSLKLRMLHDRTHQQLRYSPAAK